jgi:hypothetical protein
MKLLAKPLIELSMLLLVLAGAVHAQLPGFDLPVAGRHGIASSFLSFITSRNSNQHRKICQVLLTKS